ncbi:PREDICTED: mediator of RNA polymerase II transcription subunit 19 [Ficedula albicollis]|uniref:mediator of RNA polymerase II transcription subunit 19 n=1 Tax=Ficedula albicollis TaxID=59894 RepID=UPI0007AD8A20|nr:PREDICTED: mediator of RNA polymerase II transcription subunit 19 [Ficedula albicollis]
MAQERARGSRCREGEGPGSRCWGVQGPGRGWAEGLGVSSGPFLLPISSRGYTGTTELTGSTNLITHYNLEHAYNKFCGKKVKEKLSNFLPDLPGMIDLPGSHDSSSLRSLIEKPPICGSSFTPLTGAMLTGFRLHAGPLPEQCRLMHIQPPKKKNKHKHKQSRTQDPVPPETPSDSDHKKKKKKKEEDPERKRKKKEKKKKKALSFLCRTGTAQSTRGWAAPRPAAACGEATPVTPQGSRGNSPSRPQGRWGWPVPLAKRTPLQSPRTRGTNSVGADLGLLYLKNLEHQSLFFSDLLKSALSRGWWPCLP